MPDQEATAVPSEQPSTSKPKARDTAIGCGVMLVIGVLVLTRCWKSPSPDPAQPGSSTTKSVAPKQSESEANRAALIAEMRRENDLDFPTKVRVMKYGASEQWATALFGEPWREHRDGKGGHHYIWAGNGVVLFAVFENGKCVSYKILDEEDVKAMQLDP